LVIVKNALFALFMLISSHARSQTFPVTGQLPSTAFPVCGTKSFNQSVVPIGWTNYLAVPGCGGYPDTNPFWYEFTCFSGGTLGFLITPKNRNDDYDWMLFDITGHNPEDVFTDPSLVVSGNWAGTYGLTGARSGGSNHIECASDPIKEHVPTFSTMPVLKQGHKYLLLISHYTETQSGYSLNFNGGTAVITDPKEPHLQSAVVQCDRQSITLILNKQMQCSSLSSNGSDFTISSFTGSVTGATGTHCSNGFDMDSILITLSTPMAPGNYSIVMQAGSDGNTLLDDCERSVPPGESIPFTVLPPHPTPFDSLSPPACDLSEVELIFSDAIQCSSIAPDGSDFTISGNPGVFVTRAAGVCTGGLTRSIRVGLNAPIVRGGNYQVSLVTGHDGNTIINECGIETPPGPSLSFTTKDTVSAAFSYDAMLGCTYDTIKLIYLPANGVNEWIWNIDAVFASDLLSPELVETVFGIKNLQHIVSNGFCSDTVNTQVDLDNTLKASFQSPGEVCPKDVMPITNTSVGKIVSWLWDFGDGSSSVEQMPGPHLFPDSWGGKIYTVRLIVQNNLGCYDTATTNVTKLQSCFITVPNAFTPNGDGKNDFLYPLNAFMAKDLEFSVYNRYGQLVFMTRDWTHKWDGTIGGKPQPTGTYVWTLRYTDGPSGKLFFLRGSSVLIR
jgi:gliding motility-associated-like protein